MATTGEPAVVNARAAAQTWDGKRLPGPWLTLRALDAAAAMAATHGTGTVVDPPLAPHRVPCCLSAPRDRARPRRNRPELGSDRRSGRSARRPDADRHAESDRCRIAHVRRPDPGRHLELDHEHGIREAGDERRHAGCRAPGSSTTRATRPTIRVRCSPSPKGALLPLGGLDAGYKGFGLALLIEAMTAGLAGHGRADPPEGWGGTVFVQVLDPEAFGGLAAFRRQMDHMVRAAHESKPRAGVARVRLPGEAGMARLRDQRERGVALYPTIMPALAPWAAKLGVALPG